MTITIFVEPDSLAIFLEVTNVLENLEPDNGYKFNPSDLKFREEMSSNYIWINMDIKQYIKLKYCMNINRVRYEE